MPRHSCQSEAMRSYGMYVTCLFCCCVFFLGGIVQSANDCPEGRFGNRCDKNCNENCGASSAGTKPCDKFTGECLFDCDTGWYGRKCDTQCYNKCIGGCHRDGYCTDCPEGRYGYWCDRYCSYNCNSSSLGTKPCDRSTGFCSLGCQDDWYGDSCEQACSSNCAPPRPPSSGRRCDEVSGYCLKGCSVGWYGALCNMPCQGACDANGCNQSTGYCFTCASNFVPPECDKCVQGRYGPSCSLQCSDSCRNECDKNTGGCKSCNGNYALPWCTWCTVGWYGTSCDMQCHGTCSTSGCIQSTGKCFSCAKNFAPPECNRCTNGWYGALCNMSCQGACDATGCNQSTGKCFTCASNFAPPECNSCLDGKFGNTCEKSCSSNCRMSQAGTKSCERNFGSCMHGCMSGWEGGMCNQKVCSHHCVLSNNVCERQTGYCLQGCQDGWYSDTCEQSCSSNCAVSSATFGGKMCQRQSGSCSNGCIEGWYGSFCNMTCRGTCSAGCNRTTGKCTSCKGNFTMPECTECIQGFYGMNCTEFCGRCIHNEVCSPVDGLCANGCTEGFSGNDCKMPIALDTQSATAGITGGVVAALVVIIVVLIIIIMYRRRRRQMKNEPTEEKSGNSEPFYNNILTQEMHLGSDSTPLHVYGNISSSSSHGLLPRKMPRRNISVTNDTHSPSADKYNAGVDIHKYENIGAVASAGQTLVLKPSQDARVSLTGAKDIKTDAEEDVFEEGYDDIYNSEDIYSAYKPNNPSPQLDTLQRSLLASLASGELSTQFELLPKGMISSHKEGVKPANIKKNRFKALCAYDHSRVIIHRLAGDPDTDYINANYIEGYKKDKTYIAAQGPRSSTVNDMWWMIWQERITQIVMLTNLTEGGKNKCDEYWPKAGTPCTYGHVEVTNVDEEQRADFIKRSFSIKEKGTTDKRQLEQYHYVAWPDHGVPPATSLVNFWRYIKARADPNAPPLVHCSAGVGRTGTYIALDIAMDIAVDKGDVDVHNIVNNLRKDRCIMVQTEAQYKFLHEVILEAYTSHKTRLTFKRFQELFPEEINIHKNNKIIDNEYKMLQQMGEFHPKSIHDVSSSKENMKKNRNVNVLPDDNHLAYLAAEGSGGNTYINATYVSSFKQRKGVILTQLPIPDTLQDFWRLVDCKEINTIVSLGSNNDVTSIKNFCHYWPKTVNESLTIGPYVINLMTSASIGTNLSSYNLSIWTEKKTWEVRLLHYTNWTGDLPDNTGEIIHLVDTLSTSRVQTDTCPLLFQCIDGASRSGLFSLSCDIVNRAVCDREIDIFQSARQVQSIRPQAVTKEAQYRYCYKLAQDYQRHMELYQNT